MYSSRRPASCRSASQPSGFRHVVIGNSSGVALGVVVGGATSSTTMFEIAFVPGTAAVGIVADADDSIGGVLPAVSLSCEMGAAFLGIRGFFIMLFPWVSASADVTGAVIPGSRFLFGTLASKGGGTIASGFGAVLIVIACIC